MFVDAASGHIEVEFQTFFSAQETINAIKRCEQKARDEGIVIQECQFDNGSSFTSRSSQDCPLDQGQTCRFSGAGSHHQNGRAERGIRTTMGSARTMLLHSASHWSCVADAGLWPMSVLQSVWTQPSSHVGKKKQGCEPKKRNTMLMIVCVSVLLA